MASTTQPRARHPLAAVSAPWIVDGADADDRTLCGGKMVGLARLARAGFAVPASICVTTAFFRDWFGAAGLAAPIAALTSGRPVHDPAVREDILAEIRCRLQTAAVPDAMVFALRDAVDGLRPRDTAPIIVRSSAIDEDSGHASYAGVHASVVLDDRSTESVLAAITTCWTSLWTEAAWTYRDRLGVPHAGVTMAVIVQRFVPADRAGVVFSADPLTGDRQTVVIEVAPGAGAAVVSGRVVPDTYRVWGDRWIERTSAIPGRPALTDAHAVELAHLAKAVERTVGAPADVEWVFEGRMFWLIQARPITALSPDASTGAGTSWTRANLKEVFPELPSPLTLSYLSIALDRMFTSYHVSQGFVVPPGAHFVRVFRGRPYLNLTLMHRMTQARGGDPGVVARLFGGLAAPPPSTTHTPARLTPGDGLRLAREMLATFFRTPGRGRRLFRKMLRQATALRSLALEGLDGPTLTAHLERFRTVLLHETTMRRLHEVVSAQSRAYMALERLLAGWIGSEAETLVKRLMTGLGTLPNVQMTYRVMEIAALATSEPRARAFFLGDLEDSGAGTYRAALAGTRCLVELDRFLEDFGHRGTYESDAMCVRFSEDPRPVLRLVGLHARAAEPVDARAHAADRHRARRAAVADVHDALRDGRGRLAFAARWAVFVLACEGLQRLLALRDECRHVTTFMVAHLRRVALEIGRRATGQGRLATPDDVFLVSLDELPRVLMDDRVDWRGVARDRRLERSRNERHTVPDLLREDEADDGRPGDLEPGEDLAGLGVSPGVVTGTVQVLRSADDLRHLRGDIVVFPTIEPTLTPIFPLIHGLVTEMGGLLSHAAILAREYGLPAVVNVRDATRRLRDGDRVRLDGTTGRLRVLERGDGRVEAGAGTAAQLVGVTAASSDPEPASGTSRPGDVERGPR
jgi:rifampicin phosphotransferase